MKIGDLVVYDDKEDHNIKIFKIRNEEQLIQSENDDRIYKLTEDFEIEEEDDIPFYIVIDYFKNEIKEYGFELKDSILYHLSYSQGDGLVFDFTNVNIETFLKKKNILNKFPNVLKYQDKIELMFYSVPNNFATFYCHEKTRFTDVDFKSYNVDIFENKEFDELEKEVDDLKDLIEQTRLELCINFFDIFVSFYEECLELIPKSKDERN